MRALDSKLASALVMQSPFLESPAGSKGCWLAPKASLAPVCVQFLAPRWSLKRLPARAAARGLPKRRAGLLAPTHRTVTRRSCSWVDSVDTGCFSLRTQANFSGVDQSPAHSPLQTAPDPRTPDVDIAIIYEACPRPNLRILWIMDIRRGRTIYTFFARTDKLLTDQTTGPQNWAGLVSWSNATSRQKPLWMS